MLIAVNFIWIRNQLKVVDYYVATKGDGTKRIIFLVVTVKKNSFWNNSAEPPSSNMYQYSSQVRKQLNSVGYYSDAESVRTNGLPTPTASTPTCSPLPIATPTPTPNGRGSSADSGVRLSSDRESTASHDGETIVQTVSVK